MAPCKLSVWVGCRRGFSLNIGFDSVSSILSQVAVDISGLLPCPRGFPFADRDLVVNK